MNVDPRPVVCLTGDLHHAGLRTGNQRAADDSEVRLAGRYLRLLEEASVKVTFFVSGKCFTDEWTDLAPICASPQVEVGGHNWSCFDPALPHRVWKKLTGSYNGPAAWQRLDVARTQAVAWRRAGRRLRAWRNHMYMHAPTTDRVLADAGIAIVSDGVRAAQAGPSRTRDGVWSFPINVLPDHEHLYHAERTPAAVAAWVRRHRWRDDFGSDSYHVEEWTDRVVAQLHAHAAAGRVANLIIHPITLYLADRWRSFRRILDVLAASRTVWMTELVPAEVSS